MLNIPWRQLGWIFDTFSVGYDSTLSNINFLMTNAFSIISHVLKSERESPKVTIFLLYRLFISIITITL